MVNFRSVFFAGKKGLNLFDGIGECENDDTLTGVYASIAGWYLHDAFTHNGAKNRAWREGYLFQKLTHDLRVFLRHQFHSLGLAVVQFYDRKRVSASDVL